MDPIRIACVRYLNTAPLIEGLEKVQGLTLVPAVPSVICDMVKSGQADLGLCSVVDSVGLPGVHDNQDAALTLVPAGMIGCDGPTLTVRVFSSIPFNQVTTLHADTDSHTSVILAQVILNNLFGIRPKVIGFDARERMPVEGQAAGSTIDDSWPKTVLLIGDKVVTDCPPTSRYPHQLDLGEAWKQLTGLPFAYAVWMCRPEDADSQKIKTAAALLDRQRRHNATRLDWVIARREATSRWPTDEAQRYLGELLRFDVGSREREAVTRFIAEAASLGLVANREPIWA